MRPRLGLLAGLFLAGLALRPQIVGVGPLIPSIQDDLDISHAVAGLLGTIPVLCMGVFALPASVVTRRYGTRLAIAACLALIGVFGIARAAAPGAAAVIALTFGVGLGLGFAQALMPVAVKERFSARPAFATGIYVLGINIGSALSSALAVPIADAAGGWRWSLAVFSGVTVGLVFVWGWLTRDEPPHRRPDVAHFRLPWRNPVAWMLVGIFGAMAVRLLRAQLVAPRRVRRARLERGEGGSIARRSQHCSARDHVDHSLACRPPRFAALVLRRLQRAARRQLRRVRRCCQAAPGPGRRSPGSARVRCSRS